MKTLYLKQGDGYSNLVDDRTLPVACIEELHAVILKHQGPFSATIEDTDDDEANDPDRSTTSQLIWAQVPADIREEMVGEYINANYDLDEDPGLLHERATQELTSMEPDVLRDHLRNAVGYEAPMLGEELPADDPVWTATAIYGPNEDVEPIVVVAITSQAAEEQLDNAIHEHCKGDEHEINLWITYEPRGRKVLK